MRHRETIRAIYDEVAPAYAAALPDLRAEQPLDRALLRALAGLDPLEGGEIRWGSAHRRSAVVFQSPALFPWLSVRENVALGLGFQKNRDAAPEHSVDELLGILGLADAADQRPATLSGGQAQRVAIGRALAIGPDTLFADEPFSALDPRLRAELGQWLRELVTQLGISLVLVTHDLDEALALGDRLAFLGGPAGIEAEWELAGLSEADLAAVRAEARALYSGRG